MVRLLTAIIFCVVCARPEAYGYIYRRDTQTGRPVRMNLTPESPKATFLLSGDAPAFKNKDKFLGGIYSSLSDRDFLKALITEAMKRWNEVEDSYLELVLSDTPGPGKDPNDRINNLSFGGLGWSEAGVAIPTDGTTEADSQFIVDCDIALRDETDPDRLAHVVLHELGHCLGLGHPHYTTKAVMSYSTSGNPFSLFLDDKAGVTVLYPVSYEKRKDIIPLCGSVAARRSASPSAHYASLALLCAPFMGFALARQLRRIRKRTEHA